MDAEMPKPIDALPMTACLAVGSIALLVLGVQPVLLGPLVAEGRIGDSGVGHLVTVELVAMALGSLLGTRLLRQFPVRPVATVGAIVLLLANAAMIMRGGPGLLLGLRGVAGLAEGLLLGLPVIAIARSQKPERLAALFLVGQTAFQLIVAAIMPNLIFAGSRADAGFLILAAAAAMVIPLTILTPTQLRPAAPDPTAGALTVRSAAGLLGSAAYLGGIVVVWSYFGLWIARQGHPPAMEGVAVALSLASQVCGALVAAKLGDRLRNRLVIAGAAAGEGVLVLALLAFGHSSAAVYAFSIGFGFLWLFALPSFTGLLIEIDPRRRAALYLSAAQLGGSALLPSLAGPIVETIGVDGASWFGIASFSVTILLMVVARPAPLSSATSLR